MEVVAAVLKYDRKVLLCQRSTKGSHPGRWEFPGGKVITKETHLEALCRELGEELQISISEPNFKPITTIDQPTFRIHFYGCHLQRLHYLPVVHQAVALVDPKDFQGFSFCPSDQKALPKIQNWALAAH